MHTQREYANSPQMVDLIPGPSCCETTVLSTVLTAPLRCHRAGAFQFLLLADYEEYSSVAVFQFTEWDFSVVLSDGKHE